MSRERISRRRFLRGSLGAAAAAAALVPRHVLGGPGAKAPSDTITHAIIGLGGMGRGHIGYCRSGKLLAVADVDTRNLAIGLKRAGAGVKGYGDFREVLDRGDIDVVHVPTPPHWHALVSIAAAEAGCDIWCEKPMTRTIA